VFRLQKYLRGRPGWGIVFSLLVLLTAELWLHTDDFLYKYRSVFAAGRAMDKIAYIESNPMDIIVAGNSRVDNGFSPKVIIDELSLKKNVFNLGIPGANARILYGLFSRFIENDVVGKQGIKHVVFGLDESFFQEDDSLGYAIFFANRKSLFDNHEFKDYFGSICRLWSYSSNLKQLREPAKLERFVQASMTQVEAWGGAASEGLGFRAAKKGEFQNLAQVMQQDVGSKKPPDPLTLNYFWQLIKLLQNNDVKISIVFPPLLGRDVMFLSDEIAAQPYLNILHELKILNIPIMTLDEAGIKKPEEFANPGHLNRRGARKYSILMAQEMLRIWPEISVSHDI